MSIDLAADHFGTGFRSSDLNFTIVDRLEVVQDVWQRFQKTAATSPHQSFEWVSAWLDRSDEGRAQEVKIVVVSTNTGSCIAILPLGIRRERGCSILEWLGGNQGNYASGLFCRDAWDGSAAPDFASLWSDIVDQIGPVDVVHLSAQPDDISGLANPFAALPHTPAASSSHWFTLDQDWEAHYNSAFSSSSRRKLRKSERNLAKHGELSLTQVDDRQERLDVLAWIMDRKRERFSELGIADMFADRGVRSFYRDLVTMPHETATVSPRIHALRCGGELVAANLGLFYQNRFYGLVIGTTNGPLRHDQPGKHLFRMTVASCAEQGIKVFDGGVGDDSYKLRWCTEERQLFHTLLPLSASGRIYVLIENMQLRAKAHIKSSPQLWSAFKQLRRLGTYNGSNETKSG